MGINSMDFQEAELHDTLRCNNCRKKFRKMKHVRFVMQRMSTHPHNVGIVCAKCGTYNFDVTKVYLSQLFAFLKRLRIQRKNMEIVTPFKDSDFQDLITKQLVRVDKEHGVKYNSPEEAMGVAHEEFRELRDAVREGKGKVTTHVMEELLDLACCCFRLSRSCEHQTYGKREDK